MAKELLELGWIEELLPQEHIRKRMFGGFSYYLDEKLLLVLFESTGSREYRGEKFPFEIWNGCMFPAEKEHHSAIFAAFPFLINHPVLPKWLYLPIESEDFESRVESVVRELRRRNPLFGSYRKPKSARKAKVGTGGKRGSESKGRGKGKPTKASDEKIDRIDTRTPRMFSDEPSQERLNNAKNISDLRSLGPVIEKDFAKAGIKSAPQLIKLGWKKAMTMFSKVNPKKAHALYAYAVIAAIQDKDWAKITEEEKTEARELMKSLRAKASPKKPATKKTVKKKAKKK